VLRIPRPTPWSDCLLLDGEPYFLKFGLVQIPGLGHSTAAQPSDISVTRYNQTPPSRDAMRTDRQYTGLRASPRTSAIGSTSASASIRSPSSPRSDMAYWGSQSNEYAGYHKTSSRKDLTTEITNREGFQCELLFFFDGAMGAPSPTCCERSWLRPERAYRPGSSAGGGWTGQLKCIHIALYGRPGSVGEDHQHHCPPDPSKHYYL